MPEFGQTSFSRLRTCHQDLQRLFFELIKDTDCSITCGFRGQAEQDAAYADGFSKLKWPNGRHNKLPSLAVDVIPYPFNGWQDEEQFKDFAAKVKSKADELGIEVTWGGDWRGFKDLPHWQIDEAEC